MAIKSCIECNQEMSDLEMIAVFSLIVMGLVADLMAVNRKLLEDIKRRVWKLETELESTRDSQVLETDHAAS